MADTWDALPPNIKRCGFCFDWDGEGQDDWGQCNSQVARRGTTSGLNTPSSFGCTLWKAIPLHYDSSSYPTEKHPEGG